MQAHLAELYGKGKIYDVKNLPGCGWVIHAQSMISDIRKDGDCVTLIAGGWGDKRYHVLVSGVYKEPGEVRARKVVKESNRALAFESAEKEFFSECKYPVIRLNEKSEIQIRQRTPLRFAMEFSDQLKTVKLRGSRRRLGESETERCLSGDSDLLLRIVEEDCFAAVAMRYSYCVPRDAYCVSVWCGRYRSRGIMVLFAALLSFRWPNIAAG